MNLRSSNRRSGKSGFTLLETLIAFTIITMVIVGGYVAVSWSLARELRAADSYSLTEFAHAMLTQYIVTYPDTAAQGHYKNALAWRIAEEPHPVDGLAELGLDIHYREIDIVVWRVNVPNNTVELSAITARRGPQP